MGAVPLICPRCLKVWPHAEPRPTHCDCIDNGNSARISQFGLVRLKLPDGYELRHMEPKE